MQRLAVVFCCLATLAISPTLNAQWQLSSELIAAAADGGQRGESWLSGGVSKLDLSELASARFRASWENEQWRAAVLLSGHTAAGDLSASAGIAEAYVQHRREHGPRVTRIRGGLIFLPTSREHVSSTWAPRASITPSVLSSWIGEEIRPIGIDAEHARTFAMADLYAGATLFGGNDTAGTLLAWRGWSSSSIITELGAELPLPPLASIDTLFVDQAPHLAPLTSDLDGRLGYAIRAGARTDDASLQLLHYDNRGDRGLHGDQYAWATTMTHFGFTVSRNSFAVHIEHALGTTGMGSTEGPHVDVGYHATYVALEVSQPRWTALLRGEQFAIDDHDRSIAEENSERGTSATTALSLNISEHYAIVSELTTVRSKTSMRRADERSGGHRAAVALRARF